MSARSIRISRHLELRVKLRTIPPDLPLFVYRSAERRFVDVETGLRVAVRKERLYGKKRDIAVTYRESGHETLLITIHPLKAGQTQNRLASGRWREIGHAQEL